MTLGYFTVIIIFTKIIHMSSSDVIIEVRVSFFMLIEGLLGMIFYRKIASLILLIVLVLSLFLSSKTIFLLSLAIFF